MVNIPTNDNYVFLLLHLSVQIYDIQTQCRAVSVQLKIVVWWASTGRAEAMKHIGAMSAGLNTEPISTQSTASHELARMKADGKDGAHADATGFVSEAGGGGGGRRGAGGGGGGPRRGG